VAGLRSVGHNVTIATGIVVLIALPKARSLLPPAKL
jgi:hypothetical protein